MKHPFFGYLAVSLPAVLDSRVKIAATDGARVLWNPEWLKDASDDDVRFVTAHEVMHCALEHIWRKGGRNHDIWNQVCDQVINDALEESGLKCSIPGILRGANGKSSEEIYAALAKKLENQPQPGSGCGKPLDDHGEWSKSEAGDQGNDSGKVLQDKWRARLGDAVHHTKNRGKLPGALQADIDAILNPKKDWRQLLWEFFPTVASDYQWAAPYDRRTPGIMMPSLLPTEIRVVVAIDTSASVPDTMISQFWSETAAILRNRGIQARVLTADAAVQDEWTEHDFDPLRAKLTGRGGTSFVPVFNRVQELIDSGWVPSLLVYCTDLDGDFPKEPPHGLRVVWVVASKAEAKQVPFGDVVILGP
jgi:predicted metal-dependent peptidase